MRHASPSTLLLLAVLLPAFGAEAQVGGGGGRSVGEGSGPLSELSTNVSRGSRPVGEGSRTVGEGSRGSVKSAPVHGSGMPSMISGPVSEVSRGSVKSGVPVASGVTVRDASVGAVTWEARRPVGVAIEQPEQDLADLEGQLRALRAQADIAAVGLDSSPDAAEGEAEGDAQEASPADAVRKEPGADEPSP
jgi:hypothetical protein